MNSHETVLLIHISNALETPAMLRTLTNFFKSFVVLGIVSQFDP